MRFMSWHMINPPTKAIGRLHIYALTEASAFITPSLKEHRSPVGGMCLQKRDRHHHEASVMVVIIASIAEMDDTPYLVESF